MTIVFCNRINDLWNSLHENTVTAQSLNLFQNHLDKQRHFQEFRSN